MSDTQGECRCDTLIACRCRSLVGFSTFTFWRFMLEIPLGPTEMRITYSVNRGLPLNFYVPGRTDNMRWAAYSVSIRLMHHRRSLISSVQRFQCRCQCKRLLWARLPQRV